MDASLEVQEGNPESALDRREGSIANADDAKAPVPGESQLCSPPESGKKKKKDSGKKSKKKAEKHGGRSRKTKTSKSKKVAIASPDSSSSESSDELDDESSSDDSSESEVEMLDVKKKPSQKKRQNIRHKTTKKPSPTSKKLKKPSKIAKDSSSDANTSDSDTESDGNSQLVEDHNAALAPVQQQVQDLQKQMQQLQQVLSLRLGNSGMIPMAGLSGNSLNANALGAGSLGSGGLAHTSLGVGGLGDDLSLDSLTGRTFPGRGGARNRRIVLPPAGDRRRRGSSTLGGDGLFDNGGEPGSLGAKTSRGGKVGAQRLEFKRVDQVWDSQIHNYKLQDTAEGTTNSSYDGFLFHVRRTFDWEGKYKATIVDIRSKALREALQDVMGNIKGVSLVEENPKLDPNMLFL